MFLAPFSARRGLQKTTIACMRGLSGYKELPHLVDTEATLPPSQVKFPYLEDDVKMAMYKRHKQNPDEWPVTRLAQHYGASMERVKAILFLMRNREEFMAREKVAEIPETWQQIWNRYLEGQRAAAATKAQTEKSSKKASNARSKNPPSDSPIPAVAASGPGEVTSEKQTEGGSSESTAVPQPNSKEQLANEFGLSVSQLEEILKRMEFHEHRKENLEAAEAHFRQIKANLESAGVDTSFRETATAPKRGSVQEDYYPALFGDDGFEAAKKDLLERISTETKAEIVDFEESLFSGNSTSQSEVAAFKPMVVIPNKAGVKTDTLSRWKFAFRDLSWRRTQPTMIRTRRGDWRQANSLEDALRSWRKHPTKLDLETYREEVSKFQDPDRDEVDASQIPVSKLAKRKALASAKADTKK